jgi:hypothetical protein
MAGQSARAVIACVDCDDAAYVLRTLPGVLTVAEDSLRKQLVVRYDASVLDDSKLRAALWPRRPVGSVPLLGSWPVLSGALNMALRALVA